MTEDTAAIILAAGKGTRFASKDVNKVALPLLGKSIILYSIELLEKLGINDIFVVVGFAKESVKKVLKGHKATYVDQKEQRGTADALAQVLTHVPHGIEHVLVINGDDPFHTEESVISLMKVHQETGAALAFTTSELENPAGLGRILRNNDGNVQAIVEEKDATDEQRKIKEVNGACYLFSLNFLKKYLPRLRASNVTGEYYVTHLITLAAENGEKIETVRVLHKWKGINTPEDLKEAERLVTAENPDEATTHPV